MRGLFISFEGTDGVGKSTHIQLLGQWIEGKGRTVLYTREPGGGVVSEKIRSILLDRTLDMTDKTELLLYNAARAELLEKIICPAVKNGKVVLCDRYIDATMAYQGYARGLNLTDVQQLIEIATSGLKPDLTLWLDLSPSKGLKRAIEKKGGKPDRLEQEGISFLKKVQRGYRLIAKKEPKRVIRIPVQSTIAATQSLIRNVVMKKLGL